MNDGVRGFIEALTAQHGFNPKEDDGLVLYQITPVAGAHARTAVETAVSVIELEQWPRVPPHWIHLPAGICFPKTNSQGSLKAGWLMHSRNINNWGDALPGICWTSHVRAVLGEAIA